PPAQNDSSFALVLQASPFPLIRIRQRANRAPSILSLSKDAVKYLVLALCPHGSTPSARGGTASSPCFIPVSHRVYCAEIDLSARPATLRPLWHGNSKSSPRPRV